MSDGYPITTLDAPKESDKKIVFVNSPAREGSYTWLTGRGDDLDPESGSGRGEGQQLYLNFTGAGENTVTIQFNEAVEIHDAQLSWRPVDNWGFNDEWSAYLYLPATTIVENGGGTGNCDRVEIIPSSGLYIIVPAAGDGAYDVDLDEAVPIPDGKTASSPDSTGYWDVDKYWSEEVTVNAAGDGEFNFYTFPAEFYFCKRMNCGHPRGFWDLDAYKAEWLSSKWQFKLFVDKNTDSAGEIGGYVMVFRPGAI